MIEMFVFSGGDVVARSAVRSLSLTKVQELVGGYVEVVRMGPSRLLVNEDGVPRDLPINDLATGSSV